MPHLHRDRQKNRNYLRIRGIFLYAYQFFSCKKTRPVKVRQEFGI